MADGPSLLRLASRHGRRVAHAKLVVAVRAFLTPAGEHTDHLRCAAPGKVVNGASQRCIRARRVLGNVA